MNKIYDKMRKLILILLAFQALSLFGQQQAMFDHYMFNFSTVNPASVGSSQAMQAHLLYRNQWMGLKNNEDKSIYPLSLLASWNMPIYAINSGVGVNILYDKLDKETDLGVDISYAYHMKFGEDHLLSAGVTASLTQKTINFPELFYENDTIGVYGSKESAMNRDFDVGLFYQIPGRLFAGISVNNLLQTSSEIGPVKYANQSACYFTAGYHINLIEQRNGNLVLSPSTLIRMNENTMSYDVNALFTYNNQYWAGLTYRDEDALIFMAGLNYSSYTAGVSYGLVTSKIGKESFGSIELFLGYGLPMQPKAKAKSFYNPRYL